MFQLDITWQSGLALVINNVHFDHMRERQGSDVDEHNIKLLLRAYNFQIFEDGRTRDLNMNRMTDVIERFSQLRDHQVGERILCVTSMLQSFHKSDTVL